MLAIVYNNSSNMTTFHSRFKNYFFQMSYIIEKENYRSILVASDLWLTLYIYVYARIEKPNRKKETHVEPVCSRLVRETLPRPIEKFRTTDSSRLLSRHASLPRFRNIFDRVQRSISNSQGSALGPARRPEVKRDRSARERSCQG